jgi:hypothetical protein
VKERDVEMGRGVKYYNSRICKCGGILRKIKTKKNVRQCSLCGKTVITADFKALEGLGTSDMVHLDPVEAINMDGPIARGGGSKSGRRRKKKLKPQKLGQKPLDM